MVTTITGPDPTPDTPLTAEDLRWKARRDIGIWSFWFLVAATIGLLAYGLFWPAGPATLNAMMGLLIPAYGVFTTMIGAYIGVDAFELHSNNKTIQNQAGEPAAEASKE